MIKEQKSLLSLKSTVIKNLWKIPKWREKILILMTRILKQVGITEQNIIDVIGKNDKNDRCKKSHVRPRP